MVVPQRSVPVRGDDPPDPPAAAPRSWGAVRRPVTAVAAATAGDTRWVRPPGPCRPSKLRFDVEALRSPGASLSGFIAKHIEQPASRHSAPDSELNSR